MSFESLYDLKAAQSATVEDARVRLRAIKHYVRVLFGDRDVNQNVKDFLSLLDIDPALPSSVSGHYKYAIHILKDHHKCRGRKCIAQHKKHGVPSKSKSSLKELLLSDGKLKKIRKEDSFLKKASKEHLSYYI